MNIGAITQSLRGIQANQAKFQDAAHQIAQLGSPESGSQVQGRSWEEPMVDILQARRGIQANLQVIKVAHDMLGTLIDTLA